ncbi:hypothetical protein AC1031_020449 [Aphanomyces cochlioides]|nr:hypothetical protein AC1031_020449 [Aphanomyces cochlioides]
MVIKGNTTALGFKNERKGASCEELLSDPQRVADGMKLAADSAFTASGRCIGKIVMSDSITSLRQAAEWGMGSVSKVYRQLLLPLPYDPDIRALRLSNMFRLYNLRVRRTAISQIKNVFKV